MRAMLLSVLIAASAATPVLAQPSAAWIRERNAAAMAQDAARRQAQEYQRETRAREQRARTQEILRSLAPGELAGGPGMATPYRPSSITPDMPPPRAVPTPLPLSADTARADELMAAAMARSQARVREVTGQLPR